MQAIWLENQQVKLTERPTPEPTPGEALVRVLQAGICNTDIELMRGYYPYSGILGHEFVGIVEQGPSHLRDKRVVGEINAVCHGCHHCQAGRPSHCAQRTVLGIVGRDGAFANFLSLPIENLHLVPDRVSTDHATFTEPLAAACRIEEQVDIQPNTRIVVIGDGKLGLLVAQVLALKSHHVHAVGRHTAKLDILAKCDITVGDADSLEMGSFDLAVDATGSPAGFEVAREALRPQGTLVMKSTYADRLILDAAPLVVDELRLVGSRCGPFQPALQLLAEQRIDVASLIHARYRLDQGLAALEHATQPGVLKVLLTCDST